MLMEAKKSRNSSFAITYSPCTATTLLRSHPRLSVEDPKVYMVDQMATSISEHPCWVSNTTCPTFPDLRTWGPGGLRACCLPWPPALTQLSLLGTGSPSSSHPTPTAPIP
ncbi:PREDICTED: uncharacterized protein C6orf1-like [Lipotes vexillifer]|uniref:Uncharacterized protein C6orf1-like n=1 Tax=Lipotes vexillifer TaxID=118797 RepID=A0A340X0L5_LIPVE|nr:PREDICTED: uncharacterized protein C6orf1-like [Lipotes vexillifer]